MRAQNPDDVNGFERRMMGRVCYPRVLVKICSACTKPRFPLIRYTARLLLVVGSEVKEMTKRKRKDLINIGCE